MDLSKVLNILYRYAWLLVATILVASLTAFFVLNNQPISYKATTQLLVGPGLDSPSPDLNSLRIGGQLIQTYAELVDTQSFVEAVNSKLAKKEDLDSLNSILSTRQNTETRILTIIAYHPDPDQAVAIANAAAQTLIEMSPSQDNTTALLRAQMSDQSHQLEEIVTKAETSIEQLEIELTALKNTRVLDPEAINANLDQQNLIIRQLSDERSRLSDALRTLATIYQVLLDTNTNQLEIVQSAEAVVPIDQNLSVRVITSGLSGFILALIIIFFMEYFDDRIRFPGDFTKVPGVSMLSTVNKHNHLEGSQVERLIAFAQPRSQSANSYREVVAKLLFSIGEATPYTFLVSSVGNQSGDDAATSAGNLAIAFANSGRRVVLVDAQLHNPVLSKIFNAETRDGLADIAVANPAKLNFVSVEQVPGIRFLPAGVSAEKAADGMLNSARVTHLVETIQDDADIVLVVGSPISWFAESLALASQVNSVILVARHGEAHGKMFSKVIENLRAMDIQVAGVLFDYNPSPFGFQEDQGRGSALARIASKAAIWKNTKVTGRI